METTKNLHFKRRQLDHFHRNLILTLLGATPFFLLIANSLVLSDGIRYFFIAKSLAFSGFLVLLATLLFSTILVWKKRVALDIGLAGIIVPLIYSTTLAPLSISIIKPIAQEIAKAPHGSRGLFGQPFYKMGEKEREKFDSASKLLAIGQEYITAIRNMPPVPNDAPLVVRTLTNNGILVIYFIEQQLGGKYETTSRDKHISLHFDEEQKLFKIERVL